jgi:hypothetical protein
MAIPERWPDTEGEPEGVSPKGERAPCAPRGTGALCAPGALEVLQADDGQYERRCMSFSQGGETFVLEVLRRVG